MYSQVKNSNPHSPGSAVVWHCTLPSSRRARNREHLTNILLTALSVLVSHNLAITVKELWLLTIVYMYLVHRYPHSFDKDNIVMSSDIVKQLLIMVISE